MNIVLPFDCLIPEEHDKLDKKKVLTYKLTPNCTKNFENMIVEKANAIAEKAMLQYKPDMTPAYVGGGVLLMAILCLSAVIMSLRTFIILSRG